MWRGLAREDRRGRRWGTTTTAVAAHDGQSLGRHDARGRGRRGGAGGAANALLGPNDRLHRDGVPSNSMQFLANSERVSSSPKRVPSEIQEVPNEFQASLKQFQAVPSESQAVPTEFQTSFKQFQAVPSEYQAVPSEFQAEVAVTLSPLWLPAGAAAGFAGSRCMRSLIWSRRLCALMMKGSAGVRAYAVHPH